jgi:hypothetical protein
MEAVLISYLAGIIDGEGTIRINRCAGEATLKQLKRKNPIHAGQISVGMSSREVCERLQAAFGGSVREERVPAGCKVIYRWAITSRPMVISALRALLPYLIVKKEQAEEVLKFCEFWPTDKIHLGLTQQELQRREDAFWKVRKLNAVGAPATTERKDMREHEATV